MIDWFNIPTFQLKLHQIWKYNVDWFLCSPLSKFVLGGSCLSSKLEQKLGNISRKLTFLSFRWVAETSAKYPTQKMCSDKWVQSFCAKRHFVILCCFLRASRTLFAGLIEIQICRLVFYIFLSSSLSISSNSPSI